MAADSASRIVGAALLTPEALADFRRGTDARAYDKLGAHVVPGGVRFAVWAPNAAHVEVIGDFNGWQHGAAPLAPVGDTGVWQGIVRDVPIGAVYKYRIVSKNAGFVAEKADPYGFLHETAPATSSIVWDAAYAWNDDAWMKARGARQALDAPMSIYEVHLGSWRRVPEEGNRSFGYREIAKPLADYVERLGFTHVELMPVAEHPFYGSWGYEVTGHFAPTHRYGKPEDLCYLVDKLHERGIGVIVDFVPAHFPSDAHGLVYFDGTHLYEHADPRRGFHPEWKSYIFDYGRPEVRSFLLSSAMHWLERFHADALRVDGVSSMLYRDYARRPGEWEPNEKGGRENLEAIDFLRSLNDTIAAEKPDVRTIAEESTAWPNVSRPTSVGGLGFTLKWDMGWMHDTLEYFARDPLYRSHHQDDITFRAMYAFSENFVLPLSHDEVVYGKRSLLSKMPGDEWQKLANLRLLLASMWAQPGKKLLFMGGEFGQWTEWGHDTSLDWHLADDPKHAGVARLVAMLNALYRGDPALHEGDTDASGFSWIDGSNAAESIVLFERRGHREEDRVVVALNHTPVPRTNVRIGVSRPGHYREVFNSDAHEYGGSGHGNMGGVDAVPIPWHGRRQSIVVSLPPLGAVFFTARA